MDTVAVILAIALVVVVVVLVAVMRHGRGTNGPGVDEATLRRMLNETLTAEGRTAAEGSTASSTAPSAAQSTVQSAASSAAPSAASSTALSDGGAEGAAARSGHETAAPAAAGHRDRTVDTADADRAQLAAEQLKAESLRIQQQTRAEAEAHRSELAAEKARMDRAAETLSHHEQAVARDREQLASDRSDLERQRLDIADRERALRTRAERVDSRQADLDAASAEIKQQQEDLARAVEAHRAEYAAELSRIAGMTVDDARAELLSSQEEAVRRDVALMVRRVENEAQATAQERARKIVSDSIQRVASEQTSQSVVSVMQLPSDDLKGRIIGREGRNIRAFETITGVNVIIDDTPEAVLLSCFDPVRREVGRVTLQALVDDGRIHPHRIEEAYERAHDEVEALCQRAASDALLEVGITDLHPELAALIGQLKYRTSYGQNVLGHLIETSHIARLMAAELGVDPEVVARGAFLHDIGKALTHESQGSHAIVGADIARRYGESADVVHCIEAHHNEVAPTTVEAVLTQAADACSGGRPGARRESLESYVQRLENIEAIASAKKGVEKVFAMQAGRELRVMVKPEVVDDLEAHVMAREVAKQIEEELTYPGQVRVTVIRESRATEVAR